MKTTAAIHFMQSGSMTASIARGAGLLAMVVLSVVLAACPAIAGEEGPIHTERADSLPSYWGAVPAPSDSTTAIHRNLPMPLWEKALFYPYRAVTWPVGLTMRGLTHGAIALSDQEAFKQFSRLFSGFRGPFGTRFTPNFTHGGLLGTGGGLTLWHRAFLGHGNKLKLRWQSTTNSSHKISLGILMRSERADEIEIGAGYRVRPNARYFGLGPFSRFQDESIFLQEMAWAGMAWDRSLGGDLMAELSGLYSTIGNRGPEVDEEDPAVDEQFADALPVGWGDRSDGISFGLALIHDDARETARPESGGLRRVKVTYFKATDRSDLDFWTYRAEAQQFVPLWFSARALALRGFVTWLDSSGPVPFQRMMTNDDPDLLRGHEDFRWRGRGMAALTVEYRWPIWMLERLRGPGWDAYVFTDLGQVFGDAREIALHNVSESYGAGIRLLAWGGQFAARFEIAFSDEETVLRLRGDQLFQFGKGGLYHGRDPIPAR